MSTDPSLEALAALRVASDAYANYLTPTIEVEESIEHKRVEAAFGMADHRYKGTMPTTGEGIAAALEYMFFDLNDEQLVDSCSGETVRFVRLIIEAARRLDRPSQARPRRRPRPARPAGKPSLRVVAQGDAA